MSRLGRVIRWRRPRRDRAAPAGMVPAAKLAARTQRAVASGPAPSEEKRELLARRERLTERYALMQAGLGGVFYEMAIRDHVQMDVLTRKAAELQRVDIELQQVERELRGDAKQTTGSCPACSAPHGIDARFCPRCGHALHADHDHASSPNGTVHGLAPGGDGV